MSTSLPGGNKSCTHRYLDKPAPGQYRKSASLDAHTEQKGFELISIINKVKSRAQTRSSELEQRKIERKKEKEQFRNEKVQRWRTNIVTAVAHFDITNFFQFTLKHPSISICFPFHCWTNKSEFNSFLGFQQRSGSKLRLELTRRTEFA